MQHTLADFFSRAWVVQSKSSKSINMDISNRCTLACPSCQREQHLRVYGKVLGEALSIADFEKYLKHFNRFTFSGQVSDPVMHPHFKEILRKVIEYKAHATVHNAATHRPMKWYKDIFEQCSHKNIIWYFACDGLPKDSSKYRRRQDGEKMFEIMKLARQYMPNIVWKYIVFKYNQNDIETCKSMALDLGISFNLVYSNRWPWLPEELKPELEFQADIPMWNKTWHPNV